MKISSPGIGASTGTSRLPSRSTRAVFGPNPDLGNLPGACLGPGFQQFPQWDQG